MSSFAVEMTEKCFLHPEYLTEIFIESTRTLTLSAAGEESSGLWLHISAKHELILMASAEGTDFAV